MCSRAEQARDFGRLLVIGSVTAAVSLIGLVGLQGTAGATWAGGNGRIVFDSDVSGTSLQIYSMRPNGTDRRQLTSDGNSGDPSWSPDGRWIAFDSDRDAPSRIYVMDGAGRNVHDVNPDENSSAYPSWSPSGREIVFSHYPDPDCSARPTYGSNRRTAPVLDRSRAPWRSGSSSRSSPRRLAHRLHQPSGAAGYVQRRHDPSRRSCPAPGHPPRARRHLPRLVTRQSMARGVEQRRSRQFQHLPLASRWLGSPPADTTDAGRCIETGVLADGAVRAVFLERDRG